MTVRQQPDGTWWVRIWDASMRIMDEGPLSWEGEGGFHLRGLDFVLPWIPAGYGYQGWQTEEDGSYTAVLQRQGFGRD
ncbi:hypothetical protein SA2016_4101 (plasmid) [Sinomonas atrocyanea]|uniref:Uncharacterized protein n=2 Tax=Sinomonas atrocyanea TaxID=37927 RepID=A0A127A606_9MICC|nr:hypothetical protein SA2016_4101 [Sinomonas atrocyanea]